MASPDVKGDAARAFDVLRAGGIAVLPMDVGYSLIGGSEAALERIFATKKRAPSKLNAMLGDIALHRELHVLGPRGRAVVDALVEAGMHRLPPIRRLGIPDRFVDSYGVQDDLLERFGLQAPQIAAAMRRLLRLEKAA